MVQSSVYPGLERKPGGPDNWVERAGGLPSYIERIAKHLHYERGYSISRAIATAVNTVKRWAKGGTVTKNGTTKRITAKTQALAAAAVAEWNAKKAAGDLDLALMLGDDYEVYVDLADLDVRDTQAMVCLKLPDGLAEKLSVSGGVPAEDLHVTIGYLGDVEDGSVEGIGRVLRGVAAATKPLSGTVGGLGQFPASDGGVPYFCPVDLPGVNELYVRTVAALRGTATPVKQDHGFTAHITLAYDQEVDPVPSIPAEFSVLQVVRGDEVIEEFALGAPDSAEEPEGGRIPPKVGSAQEADMDLSALLERARTITDPEQKARVRASILDLAVSAGERKAAAAKGQTVPGTTSFPIRNEQDLRNAVQAFGRAKNPEQAKRHIISRARSLGLTKLLPKDWRIDLANALVDSVIDLALTKDGRKSFKRQGKWGHGFVPKDDAAVEAKAKGSPIARKRILSIFGNKMAADPNKRPIKTKPPVTVKAEGGGTTTAQSAARLGNAEIKDATATQRVNPKVKREVSRGRGNTARAIKPWAEVPNDQKVVRNGKRYVVATFAGKQQLTEWVGPNHGPQVKADPADGLFRTITLAKALTFNTGQLRRLLAVPGQPESVKRVLNEALKKELAKSKKPEGVGV